MAHPALIAIRAYLRLLPAPLREKTAVNLFMKRRDHGEPARETTRRSMGTEIQVAGHAAVAFGPTDGPRVLMMHGWEGRGLQMMAFIDPLVLAGYRVIALDGPGHGKNPDGLGALPTFAHFMEHAMAPEVVAVIAHSMGGSATIAAASRIGFKGKILCLGGPPETHHIFTRARNFMGLPESGRPRFMANLARIFKGYPFDDLMDIEACAAKWRGRLHAVLAADDDDIPVEESIRIVQAAGGGYTVIEGAGHRNVMWNADAVKAGLQFLI